ncbi:hypothetical protein [Verrucomicrobium sp. BvORR106]|uniref:hypothetical protein n=1 Tax=Verrucomicrobium sp. BvORR106 TaxID=1403819 RepID=UPI00056E2B36|nr:hypothetical protein [Verrucomicrobium sp. BvORR106]
MPPILSSLLNSIKSGAVLAIIAGSLGLVALTAIELGSRDVQATVVGHEEEITRGTKVFRYKFRIDGTDSNVMARQTSNIAGHPWARQSD